VTTPQRNLASLHYFLTYTYDQGCGSGSGSSSCSSLVMGICDYMVYFAVTRIRIQILKIMRIHADPDPHTCIHITPSQTSSLEQLPSADAHVFSLKSSLHHISLAFFDKILTILYISLLYPLHICGTRNKKR
jgi:hypothetical protein